MQLRRLWSCSAFLPIFFMACGGDEVRPATPAVPAPAPAPAPEVKASTQEDARDPALRLPDDDEGMWTVDHFPSDRVKKLHGWGPSKEWLDQVSHRAVKFGNGCSASIVSASGLVMTNAHCVRGCVGELSKKGRDYLTSSFYAKTEKEEMQCPALEIDQLTSITDVTARVNAATKDVATAEFHAKQRAAISGIEKECATSETVRCDVITLYHGGQYHLYKYRRFPDARLVFSPEVAAASFGGDPDNFNFPRYDFDIALVRLYEGGKPAKTDDRFRFQTGGPKEGEPIFTVGTPGSTQRMLTIAQLEYLRDVELPETLEDYGEMRGLLMEFGTRGVEPKRVSMTRLLGIENALKAYTGRFQALADKEFFGKKVQTEKALRAYVAAHPDLQKSASAWDAIAKATEERRKIHLPYALLERGASISSVFSSARSLVRAADELPKPNDQRLSEYTETKLPHLKESLFSSTPVYDDLEILLLTHWLTRMQAMLGPDDPEVKNALGKESPADLATRLVKGTKLKDPKVRRALFEGGKAALDKSNDPLIQFVRRIDEGARAVRKVYDEQVEGVITKNAEQVARAHFAAFGDTTYPDATGTLRVAFGELKGWDERGKAVNPITNFAGAFERNTGKDPFALPKRWVDARGALNPATPFNFSSTNDIIGGNSGSPVIDKDGQIVGLAFDGNIHSLGGAYGYDPTNNRQVALHSAAIFEALDKVYGATRLTSEMK